MGDPLAITASRNFEYTEDALGWDEDDNRRERKMPIQCGGTSMETRKSADAFNASGNEQARKWFREDTCGWKHMSRASRQWGRHPRRLEHEQAARGWYAERFLGELTFELPPFAVDGEVFMEAREIRREWIMDETQFHTHMDVVIQRIKEDRWIARQEAEMRREAEMLNSITPQPTSFERQYAREIEDEEWLQEEVDRLRAWAARDPWCNPNDLWDIFVGDPDAWINGVYWVNHRGVRVYCGRCGKCQACLDEEDYYMWSESEELDDRRAAFPDEDWGGRGALKGVWPALPAADPVDADELQAEHDRAIVRERLERIVVRFNRRDGLPPQRTSWKHTTHVPAQYMCKKPTQCEEAGHLV